MECHRDGGFYVPNTEGFQSGNPGNNAEGVNEASAHTSLTSNGNKRPFQVELESEPPNKRAKNDPLEGLTTFDHKNAIGKLLYKTRLCFQFQAGSCPFAENCEFAHGMKELRELPHNWQEILAALKKEQLDQQSEKFRIPGSGCRCESNESKLTLNPLNWKTRICNKWESTGCCSYGKNCHFAHGYAELQHYRGWSGNRGGTGSSTFGPNQVTAPTKASAGVPPSLVPYSYRVGVPPRRLPTEMPKTGEIPIRRWKGPDKISKIYGDWIDDLE